MSSRFTTLPSVAAVPPVPPSPECWSAVHLYCFHAREAATEGRLKAAHGLFQTAILFFERAKTLAAPGDDARVLCALNELETSADLVYPAPSFGSTLFSQGPK